MELMPVAWSCLGLLLFAVGVYNLAKVFEDFDRHPFTVLLSVVGCIGFVLYYLAIADAGVFDRIHGATFLFAVLGSLVPLALGAWLAVLVRREVDDVRFTKTYYKLLNAESEAANKK